MSAEEFLRQARIIEKSIMATEARMIQYTRAAKDMPPHSRAAKAYGKMVSDLGRQAERMRAWMISLEQNMEAIQDERYRYILRRRFIDGCSLVRIARDMHYSYENTRKLSAKAMRAFEREYIKRHGREQN